jgi:hypothetical protein
MDNQDFTQLVDLFREGRGRITYLKTLTRDELIQRFIVANVENTGLLWRKIFSLAYEADLIMESYDNAENGFFLSLSDVKKEEIFTSLVSNANSTISLYAQLQTIAPTKMNNSDFFGVEENIEFLGRVKQFLISKNLYTG